MPELAAIYVLGVMLGYALTAINIAIRRSHRSSRKFRTVAANLKKVDLHWSDDEDKIVAWSDSRERDEALKGNRSFAIAGALISALSWLGVLFLLIIVLSEHVLARSRKSRALFSSDLALREDLGRIEIESLVAEVNRAI